MGDAIAVTAAQEADFIGMLRDLWEKIGYLHTALSALLEWAAWREQLVFGHGAARLERAERFRDRLAGEPHEFGLRVEEIHVARSARHEKEDDAFRFGGEVGRFRRERIGQAGAGFRGEQPFPLSKEANASRPNPPPAWRRKPRRVVARVFGPKAPDGPGQEFMEGGR